MCTLSLCSLDASYAGKFLLEHVILLVADNFLLDHVFYRSYVAVAFLMNACQSHYKQMVVVATLVKWRYLALLCVEYPLHGFVSAAYACHVVLRVEDVCTFENGVTILLCVVDKGFSVLAFAYILAELVVCCRVGGL